MEKGVFQREELESYRKNGYFYPVQIFSEELVGEWLRELEELEMGLQEAHGKGYITQLPRFMGDPEVSHPLEEWVKHVVWQPALVDIVSQLVPGDLLLRNVDLFVKEPHTKQGLLWHMDTEYGGENPEGIVTAWIALTRSRHSNGALWFAKGSHRRPEISDVKSEDAMQAAQAFGSPEQVRLNPGEASFHHGRLLHTSGANQTPARRIGIAIRFFGSETDPRVAKCGKSVLVSSRDPKSKSLNENSLFPFTWWLPFANR